MTVVEKYFLAFCFTIIAIFSVLLYYDFNRKFDFEKGDVVGNLTYKRSDVKRKYAKQVVWEDVVEASEEKSVPLYNRDTIRTANVAEAVITLNDKTKIFLDSNTMIILSISEKAVNINYAYGSLHAVRNSKSGAAGDEASSVSEINIVTKDDKQIRIKDSDIKLLQSKDSANVNITVSRGDAQIIIGENEQTILKKDQLGVLSADSIEVKPLNLKTDMPVDNFTFFPESVRQKVKFSFEQPENAKDIFLEIGTSPNLSQKKEYNITNKTTYEQSMPSGVFYWRIRALNKANKNLEYSEIKRFSIIEKSPIRIVSPSDQERFEFSETEPLVNFAWTKSNQATGYELEVSQKEDFSGVKKFESKTTGIAVRLDAGSYFFRVITKSDFTNAITSSSIGRFQIAKKDIVFPPEPISPEKGKRINQSYFEVGGVNFNWDKKREIRQTEFWLSSEPDFKTKTERIVTTGYLVLNQKLSTGHYFWKIRGLSGNNKPLTEFSRVYDFYVIENEKLVTMYPKSNDQFELDSVLNKGIQFKWEKASIPGKYKLYVSRTTDMSDLVIVRDFSLPSAVIKDFSSGEYYWNVRLVSQNNQEIISSVVSNFKILKTIDRPSVISPQDNSTVDMTKLNVLSFSWKELRGVEFYELKLFRNVSGKNKEIFSTITKTTRYDFRKMEKLDRGEFFWTLQAFRKQDKQIIKSSISENKFSIHIKKLNKPKLEFSGEEFVY